ncbi:MAG: hypothetical protein DI537_17070 [Stutzerimonas stutzeri]|nr:MAG: hypothetical protein DI537_17070 [Stutzerimonas stutzeri]
MVTVGLSIAAHLALLPPRLRPFRARYPDISLHIIEGFHPTLEERLRDGTVDFYIGPDGGADLVARARRPGLGHGLDHRRCQRRDQRLFRSPPTAAAAAGGSQPVGPDLADLPRQK